MEPGLCDPQNLIKDLNPQQMEAVKYYGQALLIGAGAGSGKTHRMAAGTRFLGEQHSRHHLHQQGRSGNA